MTRVALVGIEPTFREPKSLVRPLDDKADVLFSRGEDLAVGEFRALRLVY